jgi:hypothetical protein
MKVGTTRSIIRVGMVELKYVVYINKLPPTPSPMYGIGNLLLKVLLKSDAIPESIFL